MAANVSADSASGISSTSTSTKATPAITVADGSNATRPSSYASPAQNTVLRSSSWHSSPWTPGMVPSSTHDTALNGDGMGNQTNRHHRHTSVTQLSLAPPTRSQRFHSSSLSDDADVRDAFDRIVQGHENSPGCLSPSNAHRTPRGMSVQPSPIEAQFLSRPTLAASVASDNLSSHDSVYRLGDASHSTLGFVEGDALVEVSATSSAVSHASPWLNASRPTRSEADDDEPNSPGCPSRAGVSSVSEHTLMGSGATSVFAYSRDRFASYDSVSSATATGLGWVRTMPPRSPGTTSLPPLPPPPPQSDNALVTQATDDADATTTPDVADALATVSHAPAAQEPGDQSPTPQPHSAGVRSPRQCLRTRSLLVQPPPRVEVPTKELASSLPERAQAPLSQVPLPDDAQTPIAMTTMTADATVVTPVSSTAPYFHVTSACLSASSDGNGSQQLAITDSATGSVSTQRHLSEGGFPLSMSHTHDQLSLCTTCKEPPSLRLGSEPGDDDREDVEDGDEAEGVLTGTKSERTAAVADNVTAPPGTEASVCMLRDCDTPPQEVGGAATATDPPENSSLEPVKRISSLPPHCGRRGVDSCGQSPSDAQTEGANAAAFTASHLSSTMTTGTTATDVLTDAAVDRTVGADSAEDVVYSTFTSAALSVQSSVASAAPADAQASAVHPSSHAQTVPRAAHCVGAISPTHGRVFSMNAPVTSVALFGLAPERSALSSPRGSGGATGRFAGTRTGGCPEVEDGTGLFGPSYTAGQLRPVERCVSLGELEMCRLAGRDTGSDRGSPPLPYTSHQRSLSSSASTSARSHFSSVRPTATATGGGGGAADTAVLPTSQSFPGLLSMTSSACASGVASRTHSATRRRRSHHSSRGGGPGLSTPRSHFGSPTVFPGGGRAGTPSREGSESRATTHTNTATTTAFSTPVMAFARARTTVTSPVYPCPPPPPPGSAFTAALSPLPPPGTTTENTHFLCRGFSDCAAPSLDGSRGAGPTTSSPDSQSPLLVASTPVPELRPRFLLFDGEDDPQRSEFALCVRPEKVRTVPRGKIARGVGFSMLDWSGLMSQRQKQCAAPSLKAYYATLPRLRIADVARHNTPDDLWMVIRHVVYDCTQFAKFHPGGARLLEECAGKDATRVYDAFHPWIHCESMMGTFAVGILSEEDRVASSSLMANA